MKRIEVDLPGVCILEPVVFGDERGYFYESFNQETFAKLGIHAHFVQGNVSRSSQGVLRGLHYQWPNPQAKLISVMDGEVYDVVVDIRRGSPNFGCWSAAVLSSDNKRQFWVPEGFAHGFCVLSEHATIAYQCTVLYDSGADAGIRWNDGDIGIDWPVSAPVLSDKDARAPFLADISADRLPVYAP